MNLPTVFMLISVFIVTALGVAHLVYTSIVPRLGPRDPALLESMRNARLLITNETTVWKAWVGFNLSHSLCLLLFGAVFGYLALAHPLLLRASWFLQIAGAATLAAFVFLSHRYWFSVPLAGTSLALLCFLASVVLSHRS